MDKVKTVSMANVRASLAYSMQIICINAGYQTDSQSRATFLKEVQKDLAELSQKVKLMINPKKKGIV